jgi:hypothetical protein
MESKDPPLTVLKRNKHDNQIAFECPTCRESIVLGPTALTRNRGRQPRRELVQGVPREDRRHRGVPRRLPMGPGVTFR